MTWNYRVIRHADKHATYVSFAVHECYYDTPRDEIPGSWSEDPIVPTAETIDGLSWIIKRFKNALKRPILEINGKKGKKLKIWKEKP